MSNANYQDDTTQTDFPPPQPYDPRPTPPPAHQPVPAEPAYQPADHVVRESDYGGAHAETRYSSYVDADGNIVERRQRVYHDTNQERNNIRYWATTVIYFLLGVLEVILALRWLFRLLGANTDSSFVATLYNVSHPFVAPFNGIFNDQTLAGRGVFEFSTLVAMLVYALIAWGIVSLINLLLRPVPGSTDTSVTTRRRQQG